MIKKIVDLNTKLRISIIKMINLDIKIKMSTIKKVIVIVLKVVKIDKNDIYTNIILIGKDIIVLL